MALSCRRLRLVAHSLLFETVRLEDTSRAEDLRHLLDSNPHLLFSTRHLILTSSSNKSTMNSDLGLYLASAKAKDIFTHFNGLQSVRMSGLYITSNHIATLACYTNLGSLEELHVDMCSFTSLASLQDLIERLPNLAKLTVNFKIEGPSPHR